MLNLVKKTEVITVQSAAEMSLGELGYLQIRDVKSDVIVMRVTVDKNYQEGLVVLSGDGTFTVGLHLNMYDYNVFPVTEELTFVYKPIYSRS